MTAKAINVSINNSNVRRTLNANTLAQVSCCHCATKNSLMALETEASDGILLLPLAAVALILSALSWPRMGTDSKSSWCCGRFCVAIFFFACHKKVFIDQQQELLVPLNVKHLLNCSVMNPLQVVILVHTVANSYLLVPISFREE